MDIKNRNGVLGLDTVKAVMIIFLTLAVVGVSVILALTSLQGPVSQSIDSSTANAQVNNELGAYLNTTGYTLSGYNSTWSSIQIISVYANISGTSYLVPSTNYTISSSGVLTNATLVPSASEYNNAKVSYSYNYLYDNGRTNAIVGNVSEGIVTFFGSAGTIFSILVVVVIIMSISIIIWAVGKFGDNANRQVNL